MVIDEILNRIKVSMKEKRITQDYLAKELGLSQGTISLIMNGKSSMSVNFLLQIAKVLEVNPATLLPTFDGNSTCDFSREHVEGLIRHLRALLGETAGDTDKKD